MTRLGRLARIASTHLGRFERVLGRERDVEEEDAARVRRARRAHDGRHPLKEVVALGSGRAVAGRIEADLSELLLNPAAGG